MADPSTAQQETSAPAAPVASPPSREDVQYHGAQKDTSIADVWYLKTIEFGEGEDRKNIKIVTQNFNG